VVLGWVLPFKPFYFFVGGLWGGGGGGGGGEEYGCSWTAYCTLSPLAF